MAHVIVIINKFVNVCNIDIRGNLRDQCILITHLIIRDRLGLIIVFQNWRLGACILIEINGYLSILVDFA